jgi:hypothetical protein
MKTALKSCLFKTVTFTAASETAAYQSSRLTEAFRNLFWPRPSRGEIPQM